MITIRSLTPADAPAVAALAADFAAYMLGLGDSGPHNLTAEAILRDGFGPNAAFSGLVAAAWSAAADEASLAGYLLYHLGYDADLAARNLHVIDLYVSPAARRQGAGRALMAEAVRLCRAAGGAYLFWAVWPPNRLAADFYLGLGAHYVQELDFMTLTV